MTPHLTVEEAIGHALLETEHIGGFTRRGAPFLDVLAADGYAIVPAATPANPGAVELDGTLATLGTVLEERDKLRLAIVNAIDNIAHGRQGHAIRQLRAARSLFA